MPEGVGYSGSNVVAGAGLDLNYTGNHVYAYSGEVSFDDNVTDALNFTTSNKTTVLAMMVMTNDYDADDFRYNLLLNNISIAQARFVNITQTDLTLPIQLLNIVIPPYTNVKLTFQNVTDAGTHTAYGILSGKIYG